jgi:heparan-alpha-glucosaminide N-acetyltransferase
VEYHASHVGWRGCSLWDLIQPSFMFMVGVSMAYSYAKRASLGHSRGKMLRHAIGRSIILILLGLVLRSSYTEHTNWTFEDVIQQIALGYVALFLLWNRDWKIQAGAVAGILVGYWLLFAMWPTTGAGYDWSVAEGDGWAEPWTGWMAHWNKNANPAFYFDRWFLNLFPRQEAFVANDGGYVTLSFVPSLATMILGLMAGEFLRGAGKKASWGVVKKLALWGGIGLALGFALDVSNVCPMVKRIWTPSFTLWSGGWCLLILAGLYVLVDLRGQHWIAKPFAVLGMNSIAVYVMVWLVAGWVNAMLKVFLGADYATGVGVAPEYALLMENICSGLVVWAIAWWMYRQRIFVRV